MGFTRNVHANYQIQFAISRFGSAEVLVARRLRTCASVLLLQHSAARVCGKVAVAAMKLTNQNLK